MHKDLLGAPSGLIAIPWTRSFHRAAARCFRCVFGVGSLGMLFLLTGCSSTTVFQSAFNSNTVAASPGTTAVGGNVVIVSNPPNGTGNWAQISRTAGLTAPISVLQCNFSQPPQNGSYSLLAVLLIPSGSGLATVEFDTSANSGPPSTGFLHLDFGDFKTQNGGTLTNTVRLNDSEPIFGTFPRDRPFTLSVNLQIASSSSSANISLLGAGGQASGSLTVSNLTPPSFASQFGEVKFYMGSPWGGSFDVSDIIVTRK